MSDEPTSGSTLTIVLAVIAALLLAPLLMLALAMPMLAMGGGMMTGGSVPFWGFGASILWLLVLLLGGVVVYRWLAGDGRAVTDPALEELRLAYARGELDDEAFEERRARLRED